MAVGAMTTVLALAGFTGSALATVSPPVAGKTFEATRVSGTVYVTQPHGSKTTLTGTEDVAVGSIFDVTKGSVQLTASNGKGGTYSGTFGAQKGAPSPQQFQALQSATGGAITEIKLITALGCTTKAADISQRHRRYYRAITVAAGQGFLVLGLSASASSKSGVSHYTLDDECNGTHISDNGGKVLTKTKNGLTNTLIPGKSEISKCGAASGGRSYCLFLISDPSAITFTFGLGLINYAHASHWTLCFTAPGSKKVCQNGPLAKAAGGTFQGGGMTCTINYGPASFPARWLFKSRQVGPSETFVATQPYRPFQAPGTSCTAYGAA